MPASQISPPPKSDSDTFNDWLFRFWALLAGPISNPSFTSSNIGTATGTSLAVTGALSSSSASAGIGYAAGAGGTVAQGTSKTTGVTLSKMSGQITMNAGALGSGAKASFIVTNAFVAATDIPLVAVVSGGTADAYRANVTAVAAGSFHITVENITGGSLSESPVIGFAIIKAATT